MIRPNLYQNIAVRNLHRDNIGVEWTFTWKRARIECDIDSAESLENIAIELERASAIARAFKSNTALIISVAMQSDLWLQENIRK